MAATAAAVGGCAGGPMAARLPPAKPRFPRSPKVEWGDELAMLCRMGESELIRFGPPTLGGGGGGTDAPSVIAGITGSLGAPGTLVLCCVSIGNAGSCRELPAVI